MAFLFGATLRPGAGSGKAPFLLIALLSIPALVADLFLLYVSAMVIRAFCPLCMASYAATVMVLAASLLALWRYPSSRVDGVAGESALRSLPFLYEAVSS
jgi:hypothetical protein